MLQKIIVETLNKIPFVNGWKTEIGITGLGVVFCLTKFGAIDVAQAEVANTWLAFWTGLAIVHHKNKKA